MVEPVPVNNVVTLLVNNMPAWFSSLQGTLLAQGEGEAIRQSGQIIKRILNEKKRQRHLKQAMLEAAVVGQINFASPEEQNRYYCVLKVLSEGQSEALRAEALHLFTLFDHPNLNLLNEKFKLSERVSALAENRLHREVDATPYLNSFFNTLFIKLYEDPLFKEEIKSVIRDRADLATLQIEDLTEDIINILEEIRKLITESILMSNSKKM